MLGKERKAFLKPGKTLTFWERTDREQLAILRITRVWIFTLAGWQCCTCCPAAGHSVGVNLCSSIILIVRLV